MKRFRPVLAVLALIAVGTVLHAQPSQVVLRNAHLERVIVAEPYLRTASIVNKLSRETLALTSEEFRLDLDGGNLRLTARDFKAGPPKTETLADGAQRVTFQLRHEASGIAVQLCYELKAQDFYTRKWLVVDAPKNRLDSVDVEAFQTDRPLATAGTERGQPVLIGNQVFGGLEYPVGENVV
ncbi:MAG: hypothetical protein FJ278_25775, partial [Planctomycetes bacterium]|nr:hypothetical protein [Planctomycetota bacterium]